MTSGTINLDPAKCAERVALDRADIEKLRAIADWAQEQAEEAWRRSGHESAPAVPSHLS